MTLAELLLGGCYVIVLKIVTTSRILEYATSAGVDFGAVVACRRELSSSFAAAFVVATAAVCRFHLLVMRRSRYGKVHTERKRYTLSSRDTDTDTKRTGTATATVRADRYERCE